MNQQQGPSSDQISEFMEGMQQEMERQFNNVRIGWKRLGRNRYEAAPADDPNDVGQILIKKDYRLIISNPDSDGPWGGNVTALVFKRVW